jgi:hypothetical protein
MKLHMQADLERVGVSAILLTPLLAGRGPAEPSDGVHGRW